MLERLISNTGPRDAFLRISRLASSIFAVDATVISFFKGRQKYFYASQCARLIDDEETIFPCDGVRPSLHACASMTLTTYQGAPIGTLSLLHREPRLLSDDELAILEDLASLTASEYQLYEWASFDPLTGALTRRAFETTAMQVSELTTRKNHAFSLILFDVDHFKAVNDRFGHKAGDNVLTSMVKACKSILGNSAIVGRLGGEEFAVMLACNGDRTVGIAERLRTAIANRRFNFAGEKIHVTASFGVAELPIGPNAMIEAMTKADIALYDAKSKGRNCVVSSFHPERYASSEYQKSIPDDGNNTMMMA